MFGDGGWDGSRTAGQRARLSAWLRAAGGGGLAVIECGAGTGVPTVRQFCEAAAAAAGGTLIRINPREPAVPAGQVSLPLGALAALRAIDERLAGMGARWATPGGG
jgi:hypothetical protein